MTHDQIVAALRRGYQLDDARESRRGCYPIRKPAPPTKAGPMGAAPLPHLQTLLERGSGES